MAVFDLELQRMCVRVVYDGVASAGKTTNLRQLSELFVSQRTSELYSPAEMDGRTLYFDWLQIGAGMVCGFPLVCQVISVPGQVVLTPRRRHLLATADVVVHVCDSDANAAGRGPEGLDPFEHAQAERGRPIPLVVQANKQDQPGALSGEALLASIGRAGVPVVEAIASDGIGVVDTFVTAVRAAVRAIQAQVESGAFRVPVRPAETAAAALAALEGVEVDPEWAAEMLLEEAATALLADFGASEASADAGEEEESPPTWRPELAGAPPLPAEDVPTGFVWPAHTGRASLRALAAHASDRPPPVLDGDGAVRMTIGDHVLTTGRERRYDNAEAARQALVRAARARTQLGALLEPETVLVAQPAPDGASWLWTIEPRMPSLAALVAGRASLDTMSLASLVASFGVALAEALRAQATHGLSLDFTPRAFGLRDGTVRYIGGVVAVEGATPDAGRALEQALSALAVHVDDVEPAVAALEAALGERLPEEERARLFAHATWNDDASLAPAVRDALRRVEAALTGGRRAA